MKSLRLISSFVIPVLFLLSCGHGVDLKEFDSELWKKGYGDCTIDRMAMMDQFDAIQDQLKGVMEPDSRKIFGRPDRIELNDRMNRTHYYFLEPGPECTENPPATIKVLAIEFESLGRLRMTSVRDLKID